MLRRNINYFLKHISDFLQITLVFISDFLQKMLVFISDFLQNDYLCIKI